MEELKPRKIASEINWPLVEISIFSLKQVHRQTYQKLSTEPPKIGHVIRKMSYSWIGRKFPLFFVIFWPPKDSLGYPKDHQGPPEIPSTYYFTQEISLVIEFEIWRLKFITDLGKSLVSRTGAKGWTKHWVKVSKCAPIYDVFGLLSASTTSEVKNDHAHVIMEDICNKFIEVTFCVGFTVSQPNRLFQRLTTITAGWNWV